MNISQQHESEKAVSAKPLFKTSEGNVTALQILENALLKEHITKVPALLVCINGEVVFENENYLRQTLTTGDYILVEPLVKHWVRGVQDSQLLLIK
jgi:quercetin dioxygenase-like cupin family protein